MAEKDFLTCLGEGPACWQANEWMFLVGAAGLAIVVLEKTTHLGARAYSAISRNIGRRRKWPRIRPLDIKPARKVQGREEKVQELHLALDPRTTAGGTPGAVVKGAGGLGKSTLARYYVQRYGRQYAGIWWIEADRREGIVESLCNLAARLDVTVDPQAGREALAQKALSHVDEQRDPWLLIFDNANGPRDLRGWIPEARHIRILVTTREGGWPEDTFRHVSADALDFSSEKGPAVDLLMQEAGRVKDRAGARAVSESLGGLPLALVNAGAYLRDASDVSFATYAERWEEAIRLAPPEGSDYSDSVFGAVSLSLDRLSPEAAQIANILAYWAPEGLHPLFFEPVSAKDPEHQYYQPIPAEIWPILRAEGAVTRAFAGLERRSLLERRDDRDEAIFAMHRLTAAVIRAQLDVEERETWREAAAATLAAAYPGKPSDREGWPLCATLTPHVEALAAHGAASAAADYLYNQAAIYLGEMREDLPALILARASLRATKKLHQDDPWNRDVSIGYSTLGQRCLDLGRPMIAEKLLARAAAIDEENPAIGDEDRARSLSAHGGALKARGRQAQAKGDADQAAKFFRRAKRRHQHALLLDRRRGDRRSAATCLNNLGALRFAQGRHQAAIRLGRIVVKIERSIPGMDQVSFAKSLHNLAARLLLTPDWAEAEPLLDEALTIHEDTFAAYPRHPLPISTAEHLVTAALMRGDRDKAEHIAANYPGDVDLVEMQKAALRFRLHIKAQSGAVRSEALKETLDLMGLTEDDARRIAPDFFQRAEAE